MRYTRILKKSTETEKFGGNRKCFLKPPMPFLREAWLCCGQLAFWKSMFLVSACIKALLFFRNRFGEIMFIQRLLFLDKGHIECFFLLKTDYLNFILFNILTRFSTLYCIIVDLLFIWRFILTDLWMLNESEFGI